MQNYSQAGSSPQFPRHSVKTRLPEHPQSARDLENARSRIGENLGQTEKLVSGLLGVLFAGIAAERLTKSSWFAGAAAALAGGALLQRGLTGHCALYGALGINEQHSPQASLYTNEGVKVEQSVTIQKPIQELFQFWRNLENLPRVMRHLESVRRIGDGNRSHWVAKAPLGQQVAWDAEIINESPNELIAWRSVPGSQVENAGSVRFNQVPGGLGTEIRVNLNYSPPGGKAGALVAKLFRMDAKAEIEDDLRQFKQLMEVGETPIGANVSARGVRA